MVSSARTYRGVTITAEKIGAVTYAWLTREIGAALRGDDGL
jgi:hypothetical protein